ncbi:unnamed protein product, partial [Mesorhabditis belari]|uniref:Cytosolic fatty-acid binding proteins domain-containing protein n=1 Tax=Mesorhabditis belari TaxID=2138241 RepID=A0AAF3FAP6_9BILA
MSSPSMPPTFFGSFKLERSENFDEYLASKGVNWFLRKMIGFTSVTKVINEEGDGKWMMENRSSKKNTAYHGWKMGETFEAEGLDGKQHQITFDYNDDTLFEKHIRMDDPNDKGETYRYNVDGDYLVLTMQNQAITCKRWMAETGLRQEMPPQGGYQKFNFHRTFPKLVWRPYLAISVGTAITLVGSYYALWRKKWYITEKFEDVELNTAMQPFLTAERDRYWLKLLAKNRDLEAEIMKDVPGWKVGTWYGEPVYFTIGEKWWDPTPIEVFAHSHPKAYEWEAMWRHHPEYSAPHFWDNLLPESIRKHLW